MAVAAFVYFSAYAWAGQLRQWIQNNHSVVFLAILAAVLLWQMKLIEANTFAELKTLGKKQDGTSAELKTLGSEMKTLGRKQDKTSTEVNAVRSDVKTLRSEVRGWSAGTHEEKLQTTANESSLTLMIGNRTSVATLTNMTMGPGTSPGTLSLLGAAVKHGFVERERPGLFKNCSRPGAGPGKVTVIHLGIRYPVRKVVYQPETDSDDLALLYVEVPRGRLQYGAYMNFNKDPLADRRRQVFGQGPAPKTWMSPMFYPCWTRAVAIGPPTRYYTNCQMIEGLSGTGLFFWNGTGPELVGVQSAFLDSPTSGEEVTTGGHVDDCWKKAEALFLNNTTAGLKAVRNCTERTEALSVLVPLTPIARLLSNQPTPLPVCP
jgi:hypothetical protein